MSIEAEAKRLSDMAKELAELAHMIVEDNAIIMGQMRAISARLDAMEKRNGMAQGNRLADPGLSNILPAETEATGETPACPASAAC